MSKTPSPSDAKWVSFAMLGDQFLIGYALQTHVIVPVQLFLIGHAVELYLKASLQKIEPDKKAIKHGHKVADMLQRLQECKPPVLSSFTLHTGVYQKFMAGKLVDMSALDDPYYSHFIQHQELYWISRHLGDLKYMGTVHKTLPDSFGIVVRCANPYWIQFFRELRSLLNWPPTGSGIDHIKTFLHQHQSTLHPVSREFLVQVSR